MPKTACVHEDVGHFEPAYVHLKYAKFFMRFDFPLSFSDMLLIINRDIFSLTFFPPNFLEIEFPYASAEHACLSFC